MLFLRDHGRLPGDVSFRSVEVAWKYKMSELQAALGRVQLARIDELIEREARRSSAGTPTGSPAAPLALNVERPGERVTYWMVTAVFDETTGRRRRTTCATRWPTPTSPPGRSSRHSAHLPAFADASDAAGPDAHNPVSYDLARRAINLPSALTLTKDQVDRVCAVVRQICALEHGDG